MKKALAGVLFVVLMSALAGCKSADYKEAMKLYEAGNYKEAGKNLSN